MCTLSKTLVATVRLLTKIRLGKMTEMFRRSIAKTISFRVIGSLANFVFAWFMTDNIMFATSLVAFQWIVITVLYLIHERIWNKIKWGINE